MKIYLILFALILIQGCSSGGGDDGGDNNVAPIVPNVLNYDIRQPDGVTLTVKVEQTNLQATVSSTLLLGTYNRLTEAFTLDSLGPVMSVGASDFLVDLDTELGIGVDFSNYFLQVNTAAAWVGDDNPTSGEFDIRDHLVHKITVTVNPNVNGTGIAGVDIVYWPDGDQFPGTTPISVTWNEFDGYYDNGTVAYARIASFAYSVFRFMYEQGNLVISTLEYIGDFDTLLEQQGNVTESCDTFQLPVIPATPVPTPGMSIFTWFDDSLDGDLGGGDSFHWIFSQCWNDDETDNIDLLLTGVLSMVNYTEVENAGVITRIGFEPFNGPGGLVYDQLVLTETETTLANVILDVAEAVILNGGFSMVFTSP